MMGNGSRTMAVLGMEQKAVLGLLGSRSSSGNSDQHPVLESLAGILHQFCEMVCHLISFMGVGILTKQYECTDEVFDGNGAEIRLALVLVAGTQILLNFGGGGRMLVLGSILLLLNPLCAKHLPNDSTVMWLVVLCVWVVLV